VPDVSEETRLCEPMRWSVLLDGVGPIGSRVGERTEAGLGEDHGSPAGVGAITGSVGRKCEK
jgi:hypothetical protein